MCVVNSETFVSFKITLDKLWWKNREITLLPKAPITTKTLFASLLRKLTNSLFSFPCKCTSCNCVKCFGNQSFRYSSLSNFSGGLINRRVAGKCVQSGKRSQNLSIANLLEALPLYRSISFSTTGVLIETRHTAQCASF